MERELTILFMKKSESAKTPTRGYEGDAGWDLFTSEDTIVRGNSVRVIPTGICAALPRGFWAQIISRSSTPRKYNGLQVVEAVIDNGYRGELFIQVSNPTNDVMTIRAGSRLAQFVLHKIYQSTWTEVSTLTESPRGQKGFGSTGE